VIVTTRTTRLQRPGAPAVKLIRRTDSGR
jgi:hypothetical protein